MAGIKYFNIPFAVVTGVFLLQGCASTDELFAEYDNKFCVAAKHPGQQHCSVDDVNPKPAIASALSADPPELKIKGQPPVQEFRWEDAVFFKSDKAQVLAADYSKLKVNIDTLNALPEFSISLNGYADPLGNEAYNKALSQKRVDSVTRYLIENLGLDANRINSSSHGESLAVTKDEKNPVDEDRRVDMVLLDPTGQPVRKQPKQTTLSVPVAQ